MCWDLSKQFLSRLGSLEAVPKSVGVSLKSSLVGWGLSSTSIYRRIKIALYLSSFLGGVLIAVDDIYGTRLAYWFQNLMF